MSDGKVRVNTQIYELSPKTGAVLHSFDLDERTVSLPLPPRPHLFLSFGAIWSAPGLLSPSVAASYRLFGGLTASAIVDSSGARLWAGWIWTPHRQTQLRHVDERR